MITQQMNLLQTAYNLFKDDRACKHLMKAYIMGRTHGNEDCFGCELEACVFVYVSTLKLKGGNNGQSETRLAGEGATT